MSGSNCRFLTCIQVSQEVGKVVWYSHLLKNFPQFDESERGDEKANLKLNIQKTKIMASGPISSWQIDGETFWKQWQILFSWAPKSLQIVTAAMKLKHACSFEEKLWPT